MVNECRALALVRPNRGSIGNAPPKRVVIGVTDTGERAKGKFYSSPLYRAKVVLRLDDGTEIVHWVKSLKARDLPKVMERMKGSIVEEREGQQYISTPLLGTPPTRPPNKFNTVSGYKTLALAGHDKKPKHRLVASRKSEPLRPSLYDVQAIRWLPARKVWEVKFHLSQNQPNLEVSSEVMYQSFSTALLDATKRDPLVWNFLYVGNPRENKLDGHKEFWEMTWAEFITDLNRRRGTGDFDPEIDYDAYNFHIETAISEGKPVPQRVLIDREHRQAKERRLRGKRRPSADNPREPMYAHKRLLPQSKKREERLWIRVGDVDDYTQWLTLQEGINFLLSRMATESGSQIFHRVSLGLEVAPYYEGNNYISIYWGDTGANPTQDLSHKEYNQVEWAISEYANETPRLSGSKYTHRRLQPPSKFDPRSFRTIPIGRRGRKAIVACREGDYRGGKCERGMETQAELIPKKRGMQPLLGVGNFESWYPLYFSQTGELIKAGGDAPLDWVLVVNLDRAIKGGVLHYLHRQSGGSHYSMGLLNNLNRYMELYGFTPIQRRRVYETVIMQGQRLKIYDTPTPPNKEAKTPPLGGLFYRPKVRVESGSPIWSRTPAFSVYIPLKGKPIGGHPKEDILHVSKYLNDKVFFESVYSHRLHRNIPDVVSYYQPYVESNVLRELEKALVELTSRLLVEKSTIPTRRRLSSVGECCPPPTERQEEP